MPADDPNALYPRDRFLVPLIAGLTLILGYAVAVWAAPNRVTGAVVLVAGGAWCAMRLLRGWGGRRTAVVAAVFLGSFALSHPVGRVIGAWGAVVLAAAVTAAVAYAVMRPTGNGVSTSSPPTSSTR